MTDKVQLNLRVEPHIADKLRAFAEVLDVTMADIVEDALSDKFRDLKASSD